MEPKITYIDDTSFSVTLSQPDIVQNFSFDYINKRKVELQSNIDSANIEMNNLDNYVKQANILIAAAQAQALIDAANAASQPAPDNQTQGG